MAIPHSDLNELLDAIRAGGDIDGIRQGSVFPNILERRRRIDRAVVAVVMEARSTGR